MNKSKESEKTEQGNIDFSLSDEQKKLLLQLARNTLVNQLKGEKTEELDLSNPLFDKDLGAFVTLRQPSGDLRGCIGHMTPIKPIREAIPDLAMSAATQDPRFPPVQKKEVDGLHIEISLLSPMKKIEDWHEIKIPGHGVYVRKGFRSGVFLPQVAEETGWDRETFMQHLCAGKAGLSPNAWKEPDTELFIFNVEKFEEEK
ncbi:MAG: AmmeMemoRadiSam system protein A [Vulcanimicrobiota bacterium]